MEKEWKGGEESSQIQEYEGLQKGGEHETVTKNEPQEPLIATEVGSEGHISEDEKNMEIGQSSSGISKSRSSTVEPKGNNYNPMVNFKHDDSKNNYLGKENQKIAQCKELIRERKIEYNLRPRVSKEKNDVFQQEGLPQTRNLNLKWVENPSFQKLRSVRS